MIILRPSLLLPSLLRKMSIYSHKTDIKRNWPIFGFGIDAKNIEVLDSPSEFHDRIISGICKAKKRICLASLYLGTSALEKALVEKLKNVLIEQKDVTATILLDYLRGNRSNAAGESSVSLLAPLVEHGLQFYLYHTPALSGLAKRLLPERFNEILGLQHMKIYIFDDEVILSGANLSDSYFTNRQDRYILFKSRKLADFYEELIREVNSISYKVKDTSSFVSPTPDPVANPSEFTRNASHIFTEFLNKWNNKDVVVTGIRTETFGSFCLDYLETPNTSHDSLVFPLIQLGPFKIDQDEEAVSNILELLQNSSNNLRLILTCGYFNLTNLYETLLINSNKPVRILVSSEEANGFYEAKGIAGYVPTVYLHLLQKFMNLVKFEGKGDLIHVHEFKRDSWSFHAKGFWLYDQSIDELNPCIASIGSPNFGGRSSLKDLETQVILVTKSKELREKLQDELSNLFRYSRGLDGRPEVDKKAPIPRWIPAASKFIKDMF